MYEVASEDSPQNPRPTLRHFPRTVLSVGFLISRAQLRRLGPDEGIWRTVALPTRWLRAGCRRPLGGDLVTDEVDHSDVG